MVHPHCRWFTELNPKHGRSYWPWIILAILLAVKEFTGVGEKLWVKVRGSPLTQ